MHSRDLLFRPIVFGLTFGLGLFGATVFDSKDVIPAARRCVDTQRPDAVSGLASDRRAPGFPDTVLYDTVSLPAKNTEPLRIISRSKAAYTETALENKVEGAVMLRITFRNDGEIGDIGVLRGLPYGLTENAVEAAKKIKFRPKMVDGKPVDTVKTVQYGFNIY
jgi:TonB family protein